MVVGLPFKEIATSDTIYMAELPAASDKEARRALKRLQVRLSPARVPPDFACAFHEAFLHRRGTSSCLKPSQLGRCS